MSFERTLQMVVAWAFIMAISMAFLHDPGTGDMREFVTWSGVLRQAGPFGGYALIRDYPPLGPFILWLATKCGLYAGIEPFMAIKLAIVAFEMASSLMIMQWRRSPLAGLGFYLLLAPFGALGYVDVFYVPPLLLLLFCLEQERPASAMLAGCAALMIKWQPAMLAPFVAMFVMSRSRTVSGLLARAFPAFLFVAVTLVLFDYRAVLAAFAGAAQDTLLSGNALNLNWVASSVMEAARISAQHLAPDRAVVYIAPIPATIGTISHLLFALGYGGALLAFLRSDRRVDDLLVAMLVGYLAYFSFNTGVHENHLLIGAVLGFACLLRKLIDPLLFSYVAIIAVLDPVLFYGLDGAGLGFSRVAAFDPTIIMSLLEVVVFGLAARVLLARTRNPSSPDAARISASSPWFS